ncbi:MULTISPECIES: DUF1366 domain-containing protein [Pseudomonadati]|uniref:DUF1366 domain-containing protein n=1 Tax=Pseudomonadati TaxID=3379134 RepID=UPI0012B164B2|nr:MULTISPECIES: DUF1366 domain-containing protein [Bacteria]MRZ66310.1 DUF1366 domain-containing protein [Parabacteroides distasonis]MSA33699.1 DUF1366 domain-containing protein [Parabacteroides distasonis]MTU24141.1 DUF1366 domain-containing protein [Parasutterella excrementihominis]
MKLEFQRKSLDYNLDGSLRGTVVTLGNVENSYVPILLPGDKTTLGNQELFDLAMEKLYQENFPQRAENEKFNLLGEKIAQADDAIDRMNKQMNTQKAESAIAQATIASMMMKFYEKGLLIDEDLLANNETIV